MDWDRSLFCWTSTEKLTVITESNRSWAAMKNLERTAEEQRFQVVSTKTGVALIGLENYFWTPDIFLCQKRIFFTVWCCPKVVEDILKTIWERNLLRDVLTVSLNWARKNLSGTSCSLTRASATITARLLHGLRIGPHLTCSVSLNVQWWGPSLGTEHLGMGWAGSLAREAWHRSKFGLTPLQDSKLTNTETQVMVLLVKGVEQIAPFEPQWKQM